ncbi:unnamed protein product [Rhizoctonia solani]|uniref:Uncharacterized protein n=1 Tax=Rhizoctonia solani TaxID=456999 RepID=A0A8H3EBI9_9AGAM|nr:unnamed protein product [Rhizoctonia solani]
MSNLPPLQHPGLQVPSSGASSCSVSSEGSISVSAPSIFPDGSVVRRAEAVPFSLIGIAHHGPECYRTAYSTSVAHSARVPYSHERRFCIRVSAYYSFGLHVLVAPGIWHAHRIHSYRPIFVPQSQQFVLLTCPGGLVGLGQYALGCVWDNRGPEVRSGCHPSVSPNAITAYGRVITSMESMESPAMHSESMQLPGGRSGVRPVPRSRIVQSVRSESEAGPSSITTVAYTLPSLPKSALKSPSLQTTHASSISLSPPEGDKPSIESFPSRAETIYSDGDLNDGAVPPSYIISHHVNCLLQYLHEVDTVRGGESRDMTDRHRRIEEELFGLSAFLRQRRPTLPPALQPAPAEPQSQAIRASEPSTQVIRVPAPQALSEVHEELPTISSRAPPETGFEEYMPMGDTSTDVSISPREEEVTPIAVAIPVHPKSEISS